MSEQYEGAAQGFDLDEDSVPEAVAVDTDADSEADIVEFDLDEDSVADVAFFVDPSQATPGAESYQTPADDSGLEDDSLTNPPDEPTDEDVDQAESDLEHTQLMNDYMNSTGVIDTY
ncbi:MAG TPA: hypothetical protein VFH38_10540 [Jatrophihabitans sp.]|nr:hypothetical protein [Jatrophihabitans sp.]